MLWLKIRLWKYLLKKATKKFFMIYSKQKKVTVFAEDKTKVASKRAKAKEYAAELKKLSRNFKKIEKKTGNITKMVIRINFTTAKVMKIISLFSVLLL